MIQNKKNLNLKNLNLPLLSAILILIALITLFFTLYKLSQPQSLPKKAQYIASPPFKVKISNINSSGFTVSWLTAEKTNGAVVYSDNQENIDDSATPKVYDEKGENQLSLFHSVRLKNLSSGKKYYFKLISGETSFYKFLSDEWKTSGVPENITLPNISFSTNSPISKTNSPGSYSNEETAFSNCRELPDGNQTPCFRPNPIYGQVTEESGSPSEAIVFLEIPGKSNIISTLTNSNGKWALDLANLLKQDLSGRFEYQPGLDLVKIYAVGPRGSEGTLYRTIPKVAKFDDQTNPVTVTLPVLPEFTPTPTQTVESPSPTVTITPTATSTPTAVPAVKLIFTIKLEKFVTKGPNKNVIISLRKNNREILWRKIMFTSQTNGNYKGTLYLNNFGNYEIFIKPEGYLRKNLGSVNLKQGENYLSFDQNEFLAGDINNDNVVNSLDLSLLLNEINNPTAKRGIFDLNNDGQIDTLDLGILTTNYRKEGD